MQEILKDIQAVKLLFNMSHMLSTLLDWPITVEMNYQYSILSQVNETSTLAYVSQIGYLKTF